MTRMKFLCETSEIMPLSDLVMELVIERCIRVVNQYNPSFVANDAKRKIAKSRVVKHNKFSDKLCELLPHLNSSVANRLVRNNINHLLNSGYSSTISKFVVSNVLDHYHNDYPTIADKINKAIQQKVIAKKHLRQMLNLKRYNQNEVFLRLLNDVYGEQYD